MTDLSWCQLVALGVVWATTIVWARRLGERSE